MTCEVPPVTMPSTVTGRPVASVKGIAEEALVADDPTVDALDSSMISCVTIIPTATGVAVAAAVVVDRLLVQRLPPAAAVARTFRAERLSGLAANQVKKLP